MELVNDPSKIEVVEDCAQCPLVETARMVMNVEMIVIRRKQYILTASRPRKGSVSGLRSLVPLWPDWRYSGTLNFRKVVLQPSTLDKRPLAVAMRLHLHGEQGLNLATCGFRLPLLQGMEAGDMPLGAGPSCPRRAAVGFVGATGRSPDGVARRSQVGIAKPSR